MKTNFKTITEPVIEFHFQFEKHEIEILCEAMGLYAQNCSSVVAQKIGGALILANHLAEREKLEKAACTAHDIWKQEAESIADYSAQEWTQETEDELI